MPMKRTTEQRLALGIRLAPAYARGWSHDALAAQEICSSTTVRRALLSAGVKMRKPGFVPYRPAAQVIARRMAGDYYRQIEARLRVSRAYVWYVLRRAGLVKQRSEHLSGTWGTRGL